jgi:cytochrome c oxidase cbb3-type subunit I/II
MCFLSLPLSAYTGYQILFPHLHDRIGLDTFDASASHVNGVLFGFVSSGLLGSMFWIVPRLCARGLYKAKVAMLTPFLWNGAVVAGIIWIMLGGSQGREYAELPWLIDVFVMIALLMNALSVGTILKRARKSLRFTVVLPVDGHRIPILYFVGMSCGSANGRP